MSNIIIIWYNKYINYSTNNTNKFSKIMLIIVGIILILFKLANLYFSAELYHNIDDYVSVYNHLKNLSK
jgi:hypothetical protein